MPAATGFGAWQESGNGLQMTCACHEQPVVQFETFHSMGYSADRSVVYSFEPAAQLIQRRQGWMGQHCTNRHLHLPGRIAFWQRPREQTSSLQQFPHSTTATTTKTASSSPSSIQKHSRRLWLSSSKLDSNDSDDQNNTADTPSGNGARIGQKLLARFWPWSRRTVSARKDENIATTTTNKSQNSNAPWNPTDSLLHRLQQQQSRKQWSTLLRVGGPSLLAGFVAYALFPAAALTLASGWSNPGTFAVLSQDASQFVQNFLTVAGLLFSILVGQTCTYIHMCVCVCADTSRVLMISQYQP
jgi:hypothetical protein